RRGVGERELAGISESLTYSDWSAVEIVTVVLPEVNGRRAGGVIEQPAGGKDLTAHRALQVNDLAEWKNGRIDATEIQPGNSPERVESAIQVNVTVARRCIRISNLGVIAALRIGRELAVDKEVWPGTPHEI